MIPPQICRRPVQGDAAERGASDAGAGGAVPEYQTPTERHNQRVECHPAGQYKVGDGARCWRR